MLNSRQPDPAVRSYSVRHPVGDVALPTQPGWDQIIYAKSGLLVAHTDEQTWTVPPNRALCIGNGTSVRIRTRRPAAVRSLYLRAELATLDLAIRVIELTPLARELLLHAVATSPLDPHSPADNALLLLLIDQLATQPTASLRLPMPADPRAATLAEALLADPALPLESAIRDAGASRRTLERAFRHETELTLGHWHRRARIHAAIEHMADGCSVTTAAALVGYSTPSAFITAFKSELGQTPHAFLATKMQEPSR